MIGTALIEPLVNNWIDFYTKWWLNLYFAKYRIPEQAGDLEKFIGSFSLNGICSKR